MPIFKEYTNFDAVGIAELIKSKKIQAIDALDTAIDLIEQLDRGGSVTWEYGDPLATQ